MTRIGDFYNRKKQYEKAIEYYSNSVSIYSNVLGENNANAAKLFQKIGGIHFNIKSKNSIIFKNYQKSINIYSIIYGENNVQSE